MESPLLPIQGLKPEPFRLTHCERTVGILKGSFETISTTRSSRSNETPTISNSKCVAALIHQAWTRSKGRYVCAGSGGVMLLSARFVASGTLAARLVSPWFGISSLVSDSLEIGGIELNVTGAPGRSYQVQFGADFKRWTTLDVVTNSTEPVHVFDPAWGSSAHRFYRIVEDVLASD